MRLVRLTACFAACALASLVVVGARAQGTIIYQNPTDVRVFSDGATPATYDLDLDGNGIVDYTFKAVSYFRIEPAGINEVVATLTGGGDIGGPVNALSFGTAINGTVAPPGEWIGAEEFFFPQGGSTIIYPYFHVRSTLGTLGPWQNGVNAYVGARFTIGTELHYGWIRLLIPDDSRNGGIIEEWAYNSVPGEFILAGQVPEPGTIALLLTGSGLLWWRFGRIQRRD